MNLRMRMQLNNKIMCCFQFFTDSLNFFQSFDTGHSRISPECRRPQYNFLAFCFRIFFKEMFPTFSVEILIKIKICSADAHCFDSLTRQPHGAGKWFNTSLCTHCDQVAICHNITFIIGRNIVRRIITKLLQRTTGMPQLYNLCSFTLTA